MVRATLIRRAVSAQTSKSSARASSSTGLSSAPTSDSATRSDPQSALAQQVVWMTTTRSPKVPLSSLSLSATSASSSSSSSLSAAEAAASAHSTLAYVRSTVLGTTYNPSSVRNGGKYLKKSLRGPAMMRYITPSPVSPLGSSLWSTRKTLEDARYEIQGRPSVRDNKYLQGPASGSKAGDSDGEGAGGKKHALDRKRFEMDVLNWRLGAADRGDVPKGYIEIESGNTDFDWLCDAKEIQRSGEVLARRIEGRGPPKKGQGRRSQMKKK